MVRKCYTIQDDGHHAIICFFRRRSVRNRWVFPQPNLITAVSDGPLPVHTTVVRTSDFAARTQRSDRNVNEACLSAASSCGFYYSD
jgi:hypothetical protein